MTDSDHTPNDRPEINSKSLAVLVVITTIALATQLALDSVAVAGPLLLEQLDMDRRTFGLLYGAFTLPAVVASPVVGRLLDRFGTRWPIVVFSGMAAVGALVVANATTVIELFAGRIVFGAGFQWFLVAEGTVIGQWFQKRRGLAFGIVMASVRVGSLLAFWAGPLVIVTVDAWRAPLWFGAVVCCVACCCGLGLVGLEERGKLRNEASSVSARQLQTKLRLQAFRCLAICGACYYSTIYSFFGFSTDLLVNGWGLSLKDAGQLVGVSFIIAAALSPMSGAAVDRMNRTPWLLLPGLLVSTTAYVTLGLWYGDPTTRIWAIGISLAFMPTILWALLPDIVEPRHLGRANGVMMTAINLGVALLPALLGWSRDLSNGYAVAMGLLATVGIIGLLAAIRLMRLVPRIWSVRWL